MLHTLITTYPLGMEDLGVLRNLLEGAADGVEVMVGLYPHKGPHEELTVHPADVIGLQGGAHEQVPRAERGEANAAHVLRARRTCAISYPSSWTRTQGRPHRRHSKSSTTGHGSTGDQNSWKSWTTTGRTLLGGGQNFEHTYHRSRAKRGGQSTLPASNRRCLKKTTCKGGAVRARNPDAVSQALARSTMMTRRSLCWGSSRCFLVVQGVPLCSEPGQVSEGLDEEGTPKVTN